MNDPDHEYQDDDGNFWYQPTAEAYARACKALEKCKAKGWQPIETVPETSKTYRVDLWCGNGRITNAYLENGVWTSYSHSRRCVAIYTGHSGVKPTHWMKVEAPQ